MGGARAMRCIAVYIVILHYGWLGALSLRADLVPVSVESGTEVSWQSPRGFEYQVQYAGADGADPWQDLGPRVAGNDARRSVVDPGAEVARRYRVLQMRPDFVPASSVVTNGGFEQGDAFLADSWIGASKPPTRSAREARSGSFSIHCKLVNAGMSPQEGRISQRVGKEGTMIEGGEVYSLSFWSKNVSAGPSYVQQYHLEWLGKADEILAAENYVSFPSHPGEWKKHAVSGLRAPDAAVGALVRFRFVTGAIAGAHGEVYLDDVSFETGTTDPAGQPRPVKYETSVVSRVSWPTRKNWIYLPFETVLDPSGRRSLLKPVTKGDGSPASFKVPPALAAGLAGFPEPRISLLPPGDISVGEGGSSKLTLEWKKVEGDGVTYIILHGDRPGSLSLSINTGEASSGVIGGVEAGATIYFAILAVERGA